MFKRAMQNTLSERLRQFPVVVLTGPRQSGKTTMLRHCYPEYKYINLESLAAYEQLQADPEGVLSRYAQTGLIIDEAQKFPELFSEVQVLVDEAQQKGQFILSGSQNFLLNQHITQSLAGRAGILELLPLSYQEYQTDPVMGELSAWQWLFQGGYPRPYSDNIPIDVWADSYVKTYLERDVRELLAVKNLEVFRRFLKLCAGRHGQILNISQLAIDAGVSNTTVSHWLSILEASYIVFRLPPFYNNFSKRLIKSSKLYFYDSGLVCYLLGIDSPEYLSIHAARGAIFEGYVISELKKYFCNQGRSQALYFWRDTHGLEVDCLFEKSGVLHAIEIKSTATYRRDLMKALNKWSSLQEQSLKLSLIYLGDTMSRIGDVEVVSWLDIENLLK